MLANFARLGSEQIFVFDKKTGRSFPANIKKAAAENGFYDVPLEDVTLTIEPALSSHEAKASEVIKRVVETPNLHLLSDADKFTIAAFISLQKVRVPSYRSLIKQASQGALAAAKRFNPDEKIDEQEYLPDDSQLKMMSIRAIEDSSKDIPIFLNKTWLLFSASPNHAFYISDNPVALGNSRAKREGLFSGLGLLCRGIEIYLPISQKLILALYCKSYEASWKFTEAQTQIIKAAGAYSIPPSLKRSESIFESCLIGIRTQRPISIDQQLLEHYNSMQVVNAERFIFSASDDFTLAHQMIDRYPELREGPKLTFA